MQVGGGGSREDRMSKDQLFERMVSGLFAEQVELTNVFHSVSGRMPSSLWLLVPRMAQTRRSMTEW